MSERPERISQADTQVSQGAIDRMLDSSRDYDVFDGEYYDANEADRIFEELEAALSLSRAKEKTQAEEALIDYALNVVACSGPLEYADQVCKLANAVATERQQPNK